MLLKTLPISVVSLFLVTGNYACAHDLFETTVVGRLQHGRLEMVVTMTSILGALLAADSADSESVQLNPQTFERYRPRLLDRAQALYEVIDGQTHLAPQRSSVSLDPSGHVAFVLIYPQPATWPLTVRPCRLENVPPAYRADIELYAQDESILAHQGASPQKPGNHDVIVTPSAPAPSAASLPAPPERTFSPWWELGAAAAVGVVFLATRRFVATPESIS